MHMAKKNYLNNIYTCVRQNYISLLLTQWSIEYIRVILIKWNILTCFFLPQGTVQLYRPTVRTARINHMLREVRFSKLHIHVLFMTRVTDTTGPKISIRVMKTCRESGRSDKWKNGKGAGTPKTAGHKSHMAREAMESQPRERVEGRQKLEVKENYWSG